MPFPKRHITPARVYAAFALLSLLVYARAFDNPFRQDDFVFLRYAQSGRAANVFEPTGEFAFYRPGALAVFTLEHALFGANSGAYIAFNFLLHVAVSLGMWHVLRRVGVGSQGAALASGLFVLGVGHYGKQIMWASTSGPLTSVMLSLLAVILMLGWLRSGAERSGAAGHMRRAYPAAIFLVLAVAPLFHEAALFAAPALAVLAFTRGPGDWRGRIRFAAPAVFAVTSWAVVVKVVSGAYPAYHAGLEAFGAAPARFLRYLGFMVLPFQKTRIVTPESYIDRLADIAGHVQAGLGIAAAIVLAVLLIRGAATVRILAAWLVLWLVPFTPVPMPESYLELRYLYFASVPFCGLLGYGYEFLTTGRGVRTRRICNAVVAILVCATTALILILERQYDRF